MEAPLAETLAGTEEPNPKQAPKTTANDNNATQKESRRESTSCCNYANAKCVTSQLKKLRSDDGLAAYHALLAPAPCGLSSLL